MLPYSSSPLNTASSDEHFKHLPEEHQVLEDFLKKTTERYREKLEERIQQDEERVKNIARYLGFSDL